MTTAQDEPGDYSIDDLEKEGTAEWDGVRNYQARNIMQRMKVGNQVCCCLYKLLFVWLLMTSVHCRGAPSPCTHG